MLWKGARHGNVSFTLKHNPKMFPHIVVCVWPILNLLPRKRVALVVSIYVFPSRPKPWSLTVPKKQMDSWGSWGSRGSHVSPPSLPIQLSNDYGWFRACLSSKHSLSASLHPWIVMATWTIGLWFEQKYCVKTNPYVSFTWHHPQHPGVFHTRPLPLLALLVPLRWHILWHHQCDLGQSVDDAKRLPGVSDAWLGSKMIKNDQGV